MEDVDMALNSVAAAAGGEEVLAHLLDFLMQSDPGHGTNDQRRAQAQAVVAQYPDAPAHYAAAPHISQLNLLQPQQPGLLQRTSTGSRSQPGVLPLPLPCTSTSTPSDGSQGYGGDRDSLSSMSSSTFSPSPVRHGGSRTSPSYLAANVGHIRSPANRSTAATAVYSRSDPPLFKNEAGLMGNTLPAFSSSTGEYDFSASVACAANNYTPANSHAAACAYARPELAGAGHMGPSASGPLLSTFESGLSDMFPSLFPLDADTSLEANLAHAAYTGMLAPSSYSSTPVMDDDEALVCFSEPLPPPPPADACAPYPCRSGYAPASVSAAAAPFRPTSTASAEYADRYSDYRAWSPPRGIVKRSSVPSSLGKERAAAMRASSEKRGTINRARARSEAASVHRVANANPPKRRKSSGDRPDGGCQCCHLNEYVWGQKARGEGGKEEQ